MSEPTTPIDVGGPEFKAFNQLERWVTIGSLDKTRVRQIIREAIETSLADVRAENEKLGQRIEELEVALDEKNNLISAAQYAQDKLKALLKRCEWSGWSEL